MKRLFQRMVQVLSPLPTKRIARERFVLPHEWASLRPVIESKPPKVHAYFTFLFLTGCRRDEARTMTWTEVDLDEQLWHKQRGKNGRRQVLPLSPQACALLRDLPRLGPYVFPGATPDVAWSPTAVKYWWRKIRFESGCPDVRIHDLRRSTASWMTMHGENLKMVQQMLGHTSLSTTQIYARVDISSLRQAVNRLSNRILGAIT
jgi:integrase